MGLDIYFHKRNKKEVEDIENDTTLDVEQKEQKIEEISTEVAYFRKVNFLMSFFNYTGNCESKPLEKCKIEELVDECQWELAHREENATKPMEQETHHLVTQEGFFWGSAMYGDFYYSEVEEARDVFQRILDETDWETEEIAMYAWW